MSKPKMLGMQKPIPAVNSDRKRSRPFGKKKGRAKK